MPTTWAEWKQKASILDNQWRHFQTSQVRTTPPRPAISPFHARPTPHTAPPRTAVPTPPTPGQPMELDRLQPTRRDPRRVVCYNCNCPGHFSRDCTKPQTHRIRASNSTPTPTFPTMEELRATITDVVKTAMAELAHTTPPPPNEPESPREEASEDF